MPKDCCEVRIGNASAGETHTYFVSCCRCVLVLCLSDRCLIYCVWLPPRCELTDHCTVNLRYIHGEIECFTLESLLVLASDVYKSTGWSVNDCMMLAH